jgi:hypothetical protein
MAGWYPKREKYFADLSLDRIVFQGDIFRGVPTAFLDHPASREAAFAYEPPLTPAEAERPLTATDVKDATVIGGPLAMVLPHPCDFSEEEKGATHSLRVVASLRRIHETEFAPRQVQRAQIHHTVWVPDPERDDLSPDDFFVDLRTTTSVDQAYLNRERRMAALSGVAWIALMRRVAFYYTRFAMDAGPLVLQEAHQHPDYEQLAEQFDAQT